MIATIKTVQDIDDPDITHYRTLKRPLHHKERGIFIVEGNKVVKRFLPVH